MPPKTPNGNAECSTSPHIQPSHAGSAKAIRETRLTTANKLAWLAAGSESCQLSVLLGMLVWLTSFLVSASGDDDPSSVHFLHFAFESSIDDILVNGVRAQTGESSIGNDLRLYTFTQERGSSERPAPSKAQLDEMVSVIVAQLQFRRRHEEKIAIAHMHLPVELVTELEQRRELVYGPFFPHAAPRLHGKHVSGGGVPQNQHISFCMA